nr:hypothetical protein [Paracoccus saliphilus]
MRIIEPFTVTSEMVTASNIPETDHAPWDSGATYSTGNRVIYEHSVWESVQGSNIGNNPAADTAGIWWVRIGATNRWRAFDERIGGLTTGGTSISYTIQLPRTLNSLCFFGLDGSELHIVVTAPGPTIIYDQTFNLSGRDSVGNFWEYIYTPFAFRQDMVLTNVPLPSGATIDITLTAGSSARVGEIIIGNDIEIGDTLTETSLGIVDYSRKERDEWGGVYVIQRPVTRTVNFRFAVPTEGAARVQRIMERIASKLCVFYAVDGNDAFGTTIPGILRDYDLTLGANISYGTLQAESLT